MTYKKKQISIKIDDKSFPVNAIIIGPFGIHPTVRLLKNGTTEKIERSHSITHVKTGLSIGSLSTKKQCVDLSKKIIKEKLDWNFNSSKKIPKKTKKKAIAIIKAFEKEIQG